MKIVLLSILIVHFAYAEPDWFHYQTDKCQNNTSEDQVHASKGLNRCADGSVSFTQPPSRGAGGWEGRCGHTMATNMLYTICNVAVKPDTYFGPLFKDVTPGVRPGTLARGISRAFKLNEDFCPERSEASWYTIKLGNSRNFVNRVNEYLEPKYSHRSQTYITRDGRSYFRNPVGVLIQNPNSKMLHWVLVVDQIENYGVCNYVVNHWGKQFEVPCSKLAEWSGKVGKTYPLILKSYQVVSLR